MSLGRTIDETCGLGIRGWPWLPNARVLYNGLRYREVALWVYQLASLMAPRFHVSNWSMP